MISSLDQTSTLRFSRLFKDDKLQENDEHDELQLGEQSNTPNLSKSDKMETSTSREDGFSKKETRIHNPALMEELGDSLGTEDIPQAPQHILKRHPPSQDSFATVNSNRQKQKRKEELENLESEDQPQSSRSYRDLQQRLQDQQIATASFSSIYRIRRTTVEFAISYFYNQGDIGLQIGCVVIE
ncbi:hypothetical protein LINPERHAP2_LOCUS2883 [Linum perenne]